MLNIQENINLSAYTTFRIGGPARYFAVITNLEDLREVMAWNKERNLPLLVLGRGANMLVSDAGFPGLVIKNEIKGREILEEAEDKVSLLIGGGEDWPELVVYTVDKGWSGLENLAAIPGTVGAAPVQNIGAYGVELKDHCSFVKCVDLHDPELKLQTIAASDCDFSYRQSRFKKAGQGRYFIVSVGFSLDKTCKPIVEYGTLKDCLGDKELNQRNIFETVVSVRGAKLPDPAVLPSAGSFFKNVELSPEEFAPILEKFPEIKHFETNGKIKIPTAWLIEQCGFKGYREGDAGTHVNQPLVLINYGQANQADILALAQRIIDKVKNKFGVVLEPEVNLIK
ncbi:MAG TPA: UDP-N-acetylmuramate dehydrogenase [bacterium]|mgnify:CR=1 FL=1|nr:UDP-N-acetylmuramate dehydrogenase [bacterium]HPT29962.1 UDP-N-acetylmuramate dehydrogenase [bacterium]